MENSQSISPLLLSDVSYEEYIPYGTYFCEPVGDIWCLSEKVKEYAQLINVVIISGFLGLFGVVTNVVHLIVFIRMGFRETINISLFALSISDLGASIMLVWISICFNPLLLRSDSSIDFDDIYYYTGSFPRNVCMIITAFLTVLISIERCLCIFFPLKIKSIMTPKRVTSMVVAIYVIILGSLLQTYRIFYLDRWWDPKENRTLLAAFYRDNYAEVETGNRIIRNVYTFTSYLTVAICTALFAWKLRQRSKWRQAVSSQKDNMTSSSSSSTVRDQQITKLVTFVAVIFILCYLPGIVLMCLMLSSPDVDIYESYHNLYMVVESFIASVGAINSCANIFVYYNMMSKYRITFQALFIKAVQT